MHESGSGQRSTAAPGGFTVLDGVALVLGAALASVHVRDLVGQPLTGAGWVLVWLTFAGIALTAAGPFVLLARRFGRRPAGYPRVGDVLWGLLGLPWLAAALIRPATVAVGDGPGRSGGAMMQVYEASLWIGLTAASLVALGVIWKTWVLVPPDQIRAREGSWTDRVGLTLAVAWPVQCGLGLVVLA